MSAKVDVRLANRVRLALEAGARPVDIWASIEHGAQQAGAVRLAKEAGDQAEDCNEPPDPPDTSREITAELSIEERISLRAALIAADTKVAGRTALDDVL